MNSSYYVDRFYAYCAKVDMKPEELLASEENHSVEDNYDLDDPIYQDSFITEEKNLITSLVKAFGIHQNGPTIFNHAPVIDLDIPCELIPSSRLNHYHLYINKPISWPNYKAILLALKNANLVEPGFYYAALSKGYTAVRIPGVVKPGVRVTIASILQANAILRRNLYLSEVGYKNQQSIIDLLSSKLLEYMNENQLSELLATISDSPQIGPESVLI